MSGPLDKEDKEFAQKLATNRVYRTLTNLFIKVGKYFALILTPEGRELLSDPIRRRNFFHREGKVGFLEFSIFQNPLYIPGEDDYSLERRGTVTGRWIGYDFNRPYEFGKNCRQIQEGRLTSFLLLEIKDNPKSVYTPTELINIFDIEHIAQFELPSIDYLIENGLAVQTTYGQAYQNVKLFKQYERAMDIEGITNEKVYQITPKGNSLVFLARGGGDPAPEKFSLTDLVSVPVLAR